MSRGQTPRTPEHFPRMKWRARPRLMRWVLTAERGGIAWSGNHRQFMKKFGRRQLRGNR